MPGRVTGALTNEIRYEPYSAEMLANPITQATIRKCQQAGLGHCAEHWLPGDPVTSLTIGVDKKAIASFVSTQLPPGAAFNTTCRIVDPSGRAVRTSHLRDRVPASVSKDAFHRATCFLDIRPEMTTGRWSAEFEVNGQTMSTLHFEVLSARSENAV